MPSEAGMFMGGCRQLQGEMGQQVLFPPRYLSLLKAPCSRTNQTIFPSRESSTNDRRALRLRYQNEPRVSMVCSLNLRLNIRLLGSSGKAKV